MSEILKLPLIIAHRGASALAPENTLAAFRRAIDDGADGLEFDVQMAKDGVPVVFHDATLRRMAQKKIRTSELTSTELKNLDIGAWFNSKNPMRANDKFIGETVPTLAQVFDFLTGGAGRIYIELKCRSDEIPALVEAVAAEIRSTDLLPRIVLKSFKLEAVRRAKKAVPELCSAALFAPKLTRFLKSRNHLIEQAKKFCADELSLPFSLATAKFVEKARRENLPVTIWTVDHPAWVKRARKTGIRAIITNNPARLLEKKRELLRFEEIECG
ncbi:MAG: glycerophosphodiester phosphodiesterase [Pyrinomonadaceae bacterium]